MALHFYLLKINWWQHFVKEREENQRRSVGDVGLSRGQWALQHPELVTAAAALLLAHPPFWKGTL